MYGSARYLKDAESHLSNKQLKFNTDGTFTVHYGPAAACGDVAGRPNTPTDNWYLDMLVYRPAQTVIPDRVHSAYPRCRQDIDSFLQTLRFQGVCFNTAGVYQMGEV